MPVFRVSSTARTASGQSFTLRGACPAVNAPMVAADGLLARVRLPGGSIASSSLRTVAEVAERFGNGVVELTSRANLQIRGLKSSDVEAVVARLVSSGLVVPEPEHDERRDVVAAPLTGHDPRQLVDLSSLAQEAAELLACSTDLNGLPPKFGVVLDDGGSAPVRRVASDLTFGARSTSEGDVVFQVELGRALDDADSKVACIPQGDVLDVIAKSARLCARAGERLGALATSLGRAELLDTLAAGSDLLWLTATDRTPEVTPIGLLPHRSSCLVNVGAAPLLGRTSPEQLFAVADLAKVTSSTIRLTPWRALVLLGVSENRAQFSLDRFAAAGLSTDLLDVAHQISACAGSPGCASSRADTLAAARAFIDGASTVTGRVHLSGCEKRCGANADSVLVANERGSFGQGE